MAKYRKVLVAAAAAALIVGGIPAVSAQPYFLLDISPRAHDKTRKDSSPASSALAARAVEQLQLGCDPQAQMAAGRNPYADTVLGRLGPALAVTDSQRRAAVAATISQDSKYAFARTAELRAAENPELRYLGWLIPAYLLAKAQPPGYVGELETLLEQLARISGSVRFSTADRHYLAALAAVEQGDTDGALKQIDLALGQEPDFYNAIVLGLRLRLLSTAGGGSLHGRCERAFAALFEDLLALVGLTRCPLQASQSEIYLRRYLPDPMRHPGFLAAQVYLGVMARKPGYAAGALARFDGLSHVVCRAKVSWQLHRLLEGGIKQIEQERGQ